MPTPNQCEDDAGSAAATKALPTSLMAIAGLICAVAVVLQRASSGPAAAAAAGEAGFVEPSAVLDGSRPRAASRAAPSVDAAQLSFPQLLSDPDERPGAPALMPLELMARVPGAVAALSAGSGLQRGARQDPLVSAIMRTPLPKKAPAPEGRAGEFTLHVISYDRVELARSFAAGLRARGHAAFVVSADVPERGRTFRVRIGPFASRKQAEAYRRKFEADEQMNSVVMRESDAAPGTAP